MQHISNRELLGIASTLRELYAHTDLHSLPRKLIQALERAVRSDLIVFNLIDHQKKCMTGEHNARNASEVERLFPVFVGTQHTHPLYQWQQRPESWQAIKATDLISRREFRERAVFQEVYRHLDLANIILFHLPSLPNLQTAFSLHRGGRDFTEHERAVLNFLSPHFSQIWQNASAFDTAQREITSLRAAVAVGEHELVSVDVQRKAQWVTPRALAWLHDYTGECLEASGRLPEVVDTWLRRRLLDLSRPGMADEHNPMLELPGQTGRLLIRLAETTAAGAQLLLREHSHVRVARAFSARGLTARQIQILHGLADGKSNATIAALLGISVRTVDKHVENTLHLLGVENRHAAAVLYQDVAGR